jgi:ornithine cyclodeaminase
MLILTSSDVIQSLPMAETIAAIKQAFAALSAGKAQVPLRAHLPVPPHHGLSLFMPAYLQDETGDSLAVKIVSVFPDNPERGLPLIHAAVLVLEASTGRPLALLEGGRLTAIRTGAASGAATDLLARPEARVAAIFGAGVQGCTQLEAVCTIRPIQTAWIYDPDDSRVEAFICEMAGKGPIPADLRAAGTPAQALEDADVVCTATTSTSPVFKDMELKAGVHINGIGSYTPEMQEIPSETVSRALVVVDSHSAALAEAGDLVKPIKQGLINEWHIHAELGEIVLGKKSGRSNPNQVTFFKSVGVAVQDAAAARLAIENATRFGLGKHVSW